MARPATETARPARAIPPTATCVYRAGNIAQYATTDPLRRPVAAAASAVQQSVTVKLAVELASRRAWSSSAGRRSGESEVTLVTEM